MRDPGVAGRRRAERGRQTVRGTAGGRAIVDLPAAPPLGPLLACGVVRSLMSSGARSRPVSPGDLPAVAVRVRGVRPDADQLTAYQHLVGEPATDLLPAGFVHVLAFPAATALLARRGFPVPLLGMVHLANHVEQRRAIRLGDRLDVLVHAADLRPHRSGVVVDVVAEVSVDGGVAWVGTSTYLARGVRWAPDEDGVATGEGPAPTAFADPTGGADPTAEAVPTAETLPTAQWRLGADVGRRYAAVSGDHNPIHLSAPAARLFGFPRAIAHGMYTAARALADVGPGARGETYSWHVAFTKPVLLPSTVDVRVAATGTTERASRSRSVHTVACWDGRTGRRYLSGDVVPLD